jgi:hypothetical protein
MASDDQSNDAMREMLRFFDTLYTPVMKSDDSSQEVELSPTALSDAFVSLHPEHETYAASYWRFQGCELRSYPTTNWLRIRQAVDRTHTASEVGAMHNARR